MPDFEVVLPIKASDWDIANNAIPLITKYLNPKKIVVISSKDLLNSASFQKSNCLFLDEDELVVGMSFNDIHLKLLQAGKAKKETGWYLQQFLKLAYSRKTKERYYLVWDADTLPLRKIIFFDEDSGRPFFTLKREYHRRYFETLEVLLGIKKTIASSFISEHMMFDTKICNEMLREIEKNTKLQGATFWEKIISATVDVEEPFCFSEFETYGTYCAINHPNCYLMRKLQTLRPGYLYLGENITISKIKRLSKDFDIASFEVIDRNRRYRWIARVCCFFAFFVGFSRSIRLSRKLFKFLSKTRLKYFKRLYAAIQEKEEFDFFFCTEPHYCPK